MIFIGVGCSSLGTLIALKGGSLGVNADVWKEDLFIMPRDDHVTDDA